MLNINLLAEKIRRHRIRNNLTQAELGAMLFVTPQTVSKWENALAIPDIMNLSALADVFGASFDELLGPGNNSSEKRALLAIDGGGTKTEFVLFREDGMIIHRLSLAGSNPNSVGMAAAKSVLKHGIDRMSAICDNIYCAFAGIAGASAGNNAAELAEYVKKEYKDLKFFVDSDVRNLVESIRINEPFISAILGTGSVVCVKNGSKIEKFGGFGYMFDTAGSGFDYGRDAVKLALEQESGFAPETRLTELIHEKLGGGALEKLGKFYSSGKEFTASFAPLVFEAFKEGDKSAAEIIDRNTDRVAMLIGYALAKFPENKTAVFSGGLVHFSEILDGFFEKKLKIKRVYTDKRQIFGAAMYCMELAKIPVCAEFDNNFHHNVV